MLLVSSCPGAILTAAFGPVGDGRGGAGRPTSAVWASDPGGAKKFSGVLGLSGSSRGAGDATTGEGVDAIC